MNLAAATPGSVRTWLDAALALLYPPACQLCGARRASAAEGYVCSRCWTQVRFIKPPFCERCGLPFDGALTTPFECSNCRDMELHFRSARSAVAAGAMILEVIHRYKYQRALWFEPFLADIFLRQALQELKGEDWDFIVPVPLHPAKRREREFNQAARLARHLHRATGIPINEELIFRAVPTRTQTQLSREARADNVRSAFVSRKHLRLNGARIILVDDVFTTGATTNACARLLRKAGSGEVCVWTVARGL
ncbi:MAG TPA: ComF family protein [Verrucomicrobiota bacterium]|nr:ComF family protein [Verrucomicrobiota bacterium]